MQVADPKLIDRCRSRTALHESASGGLDLPGLARVWAVLVLTAVVLMIISTRLFLAVLHRARRSGSLALT